ncbi:MAG: TRL domain-containing protein [Candidatus Sumerlaeia bacterium]|nr:TRL domain-containing protein [Candidatus Sumerlaeia bacterium]
MEISPRKLLPAALVAGAALLSGCVFAPVAPPRGFLYNDQTSPLFPGGKPGSKVGKASSSNVLFLAGWGDSGLAAAIRDGGLESVNHTDYRIQNYLLIYQRYTTVVYGE